MKKLCIMLILAAALPTVAYGAVWTVKATSANPTFGTVTPSGFQNYTTHSGSKRFTITANSGYRISRVVVNNVAQSVGVSPQEIDIPYAPGTTILLAGFSAATYQCTAGPTDGGSITSATIPTVPGGSSKTFTITPFAGNLIRELRDNGVLVTPIIPTGMNYTLTNVQTDHVISAIFRWVSASAGMDRSVVVNRTVTLSGTASSPFGAIASYAWTVESSPAGSARASFAASGATTSFTADLAGDYLIRLTATDVQGNVGTTSLKATAFLNAQAADVMCIVCHEPYGQLFADFDASRHGAADSSFAGGCTTCHVGNETTHPGPITKATVSATTFSFTASGANFCAVCHTTGGTGKGFSPLASGHAGQTCTACHLNAHNPVTVACGSCHFNSSGNVSNHPFPIGANPCLACHDPHSTASTVAGITAAHFNSITSAGYPASFLTSRSNCSNCHFDSSANLAIRGQWAQSGHAAIADKAWKSLDFKTETGCVQCHTTTGFIAYSSGRMTAAWGVSSDKTKEVLSCVGCHSDINAGTLRTMTPVRPYADDAGYLNPDTGKSNLCQGCHSGTKNGKSITAQLNAFADFTHMPFIDPHYMAAGGTSYAQGGYHFPGRSYNPESSHTKLGSTDGRGPCVSCHKNSLNGHKFQSGALSLCVSCHGSSLNDATLNADMTAFMNALQILRAQLAANGFVCTTAPSGFSNTNWGSGQAGANTMGAAFNYVFLVSEPGAYAHNPFYARQLVMDSIDYLDNAQFDDSVSTLAVPTLLASGAISQALADSVAPYKAKDSCTICHGGAAATANPMATGAHGAHLAGDLGSQVGSCQTCHVYGSATHMNGVVDLVNGAGSACANCHPGTTPSWNASSRISCTVCHAALPSRLPNGVAAPYKANFQSKGHGQYAASNQCTVCHDPDGRHISGSLGSYMRLRMPDDNNLCASCHNTTVVGAAFRNMSTHFTTKGGGQSMACSACHDPHGTTNLSMIRTSINRGNLTFTITFTNTSSGFVNSSNSGLCQVCHTKTGHYLAGVPETDHMTRDCLKCHSHNAKGGAFKLRSCRGCHR